MRVLWVPVILAVLTGPVSCKQRQPASALRGAGDGANASAATGPSEQTLALWSDYVKETMGAVRAQKRTLQPYKAGQMPTDDAQLAQGQDIRTVRAGCSPVYYKRKDGVAPRGLALLFHGFTACPQQFDDLAKLLTAAGFDVFMPLNPGHGYAKRENSFGTNWYQAEYVDQLPDDNQVQVYDDFVDRMVRMVQATEGGEKFVAGLSMGGIMATRATLSKAFTRSLIMAPYFEADPTGFGPYVVRLNDRPRWLPLVLGGGPNTYIGWDGPLGTIALAADISGHAKDVCSSKPGRLGYCTWRIKHLKSATAFGQETFATLTPVPTTQIQVVGVYKEGSISIPKMLAAYQALGGTNPQDQAAAGKVKGCEFVTRHGELPMQHSFFSKEDNWKFVTNGEMKGQTQVPDQVLYPEKMYWLRPFLAQTVRFAVSGQPFDAQPTPAGDPDPDAPFYACSTQDGAGASDSWDANSNAGAGGSWDTGAGAATTGGGTTSGSGAGTTGGSGGGTSGGSTTGGSGAGATGVGGSGDASTGEGGAPSGG